MISFLYKSVSYRAVMAVCALSFGGVIITAHDAYAVEPLMLSNTGGAGADGGSMPRPLYWDVQQSDGIVAVIGDKPVIQCTASKQVAPRLQLKLTGGNAAITQVEVTSDQMNLGRVKSVPVTLSFNHGGGNIAATGVVLAANRLVVALPNPAQAYDQFNLATALRVAVSVGEEVRTAHYDLTGARTALADLEKCVATPVQPPVPTTIKGKAPPPIALRTPEALLAAERERVATAGTSAKSSDMPEALLAAERERVATAGTSAKSSDMPDVTVGVQGIPALSWPELDPPTLRIKQASGPEVGTSAPVSMAPAASVVPTTSIPVTTPTPAPVPTPAAVAGPEGSSNIIMADGVYSPAMTRASQPIIPTPAPVVASAPVVEPAVPVRPSVRVESDRVAPPPAGSTITWRPGAYRSDVRPVETYRARKGEHLRDVLRRWADRGGIDLVWNMPSDIVLTQDYSYVGAFKDALKGLLSAYPESGINTTFADQGVPFERQPFVEDSKPPQSTPVALPGPALDDFAPNAAAPVPEMPMVPALPVAPPAAAAMAAPAQPQSMPAAPRAPFIPRRASAAGEPTIVSPVAPPTAMPSLQPPTTAPVPVPPAPFPVAGTGTGADQPTQVLPSLAVPRDRVVQSLPATPPPPIGPVKRWRALPGASMRQVVQAWAEEAQVNVVWMSRNDYAVRYSVNKTTDFGSAVADLFAQYARDPARPQGQLFNDPNGDRTLVVR